MILEVSKKHSNERLVFLDGVFLRPQRETSSFADKVLLLEAGVSGIIKVVDGSVECFETHLHHFYNRCEKLFIYPPLIEEEWIKALLQRNHATTGIWQMQIMTSGGKSSPVDAGKRPFSHLLITIDPYPEKNPGPLHLGVFPKSFEKPGEQKKTISFLDRLWIAERAEQKGFDDLILYSSSEEILETSFSNIFWYLEGELFTPDLILPIHYGLSLMLVLRAVAMMDIKVHYVKNTIQDIPTKAQVFLCNVMTHLQPVESILDHHFCRDPSFEKTLMEHYSQLVNESSLNVLTNPDQ